MAVAGGATTAYFVVVKANQTTTLRELCADPADAVAAVRRGERVTVQGSDMPEFWRLLKLEPTGPGKTMPASTLGESSER